MDCRRGNEGQMQWERSLRNVWQFLESPIPIPLSCTPPIQSHSPAAPEEGDGDLQCMCVKTTSQVHPKHIMSLEVIRAGLHCPTSQLMWVLARALLPPPSSVSSPLSYGRSTPHSTQSLIPCSELSTDRLLSSPFPGRATLKNGRKICLDPQVPTYKKIVRKLIESKLLAV